MNLIIGRYHEENPRRDAELLTAIRRNLACDCIRRIFMIREARAAVMPVHSKLVPLGFDSRLTFEVAFRWANAECPGEIVILANSDIWFDDTLSLLRDCDLTNRLLCLSRYELGPGVPQLFDNAMSQDAWIFRAPLRPFSCDWPLGVLGCENRLAFEAHRAGLVVTNPSRSICAYHEHASDVRHWRHAERINGQYLLVYPGLL